MITTRRMYRDSEVFLEIRRKSGQKVLKTIPLVTKSGRACTKCLFRKNEAEFGLNVSGCSYRGKNVTCKSCCNEAVKQSQARTALRNEVDSIQRNIQRRLQNVT
jgi:hypothetical protein